jgi:hypothetical protein
MNPPFFADSAEIEIQGEQPLTLVHADYQAAQFLVNGLAEIQVYVTDHRPESVLALRQCQGRADFDPFLSRFNGPAYALLTHAGERTWIIDLYETNDRSPINTVKIGVDIPGPLPIHTYHVYHYEPAASQIAKPASEQRFHFFWVYQNDPEPFLALSLTPAYAEV